MKKSSGVINKRPAAVKKKKTVKAVAARTPEKSKVLVKSQEKSKSAEKKKASEKSGPFEKKKASEKAGPFEKGKTSEKTKPFEKQKISKKLERKKKNKIKNRPKLTKPDKESIRKLIPEAIEKIETAAVRMNKPKSFRANAQAERINTSGSWHVPTVRGSRVRMIPLGGLEQIGMNITAFESENSIIIIDCGMAFPDESTPGIDLMIPDVTYLKEHADKIEGFFITHGHEDHIGALPYVLRDLNVPVFSTRLTRALIENKLREHGLIASAKLNTVQFGDVVDAGDFKIEFIKTNHSIQDAAALAIHSPAGTMLHTGDFKIDYTPVFGDTIDLQRFAELGRQGVLALFADSTNAVKSGFTMSEKTVGHTFETIFSENTDKRIIVATFASNVDRVQQVITAAEKFGRKVVIDGRSMINIIGTAEELGYIKVEDGTLIDISEVRNYPDNQIVMVVTGSQGESMAVLSRMATGQYKRLALGENDVIIMSSSPIPGNEKAVYRVINELSRRHTKVIYQDTHVSGHACAEELKLIYALVRPKYAIPVHGEVRHRLAQKEIAVALGVPKEQCLLIDTGDVVEISEDCCMVVDKVQAGPIMVDGLGVGDVGNVVIKDRQTLSQNGIIIASLAIERGSGQLIAGPEIMTRGLIYVRENEDMIKDAEQVVLKALESCAGHADLSHVRNVIRNELSDYIWRRIKRTPMILPVISEV